MEIRSNVVYYECILLHVYRFLTKNKLGYSDAVSVAIDIIVLVCVQTYLDFLSEDVL